jgi:hypothetical protein
MSLNAGGWGVVAGSQPMYAAFAHGAQINFGDLTPYCSVEEGLTVE